MSVRLNDEELHKVRLHLEAAMVIAHEYRRRIADEDSIDLIVQLAEAAKLLGIELDTEVQMGS